MTLRLRPDTMTAGRAPASCGLQLCPSQEASGSRCECPGKRDKDCYAEVGVGGLDALQESQVEFRQFGEAFLSERLAYAEAADVGRHASEYGLDVWCRPHPRLVPRGLLYNNGSYAVLAGGPVPQRAEGDSWSARVKRKADAVTRHTLLLGTIMVALTACRAGESATGEDRPASPPSAGASSCAFPDSKARRELDLIARAMAASEPRAIDANATFEEQAEARRSRGAWKQGWRNAVFVQNEDDRWIRCDQAPLDCFWRKNLTALTLEGWECVVADIQRRPARRALALDDTMPWISCGTCDADHPEYAVGIPALRRNPDPMKLRKGARLRLAAFYLATTRDGNPWDLPGFAAPNDAVGFTVLH